MMKMKLNKKIAGASAMLLLSATMLGTSTFAWFTMNRTVKVDGMEVKTKVSGNLLISDSNAGDSYYGTQLNQAKVALLEPVSSINGTTGSFYYTLDASADGSKRTATDVKEYDVYATDIAAAATDTTNYANKFSENYAVTKGMAGDAFTGLTGATGYVDYVFYLKASPDATNNEIRLTRCNLSYNGGAIPATGSDVTLYDKAWRVAVFAKPTTVGTTTDDPDGSASYLKGSIKGLPNAAYFGGTAVSSQTQKASPSFDTSTGVVIDTGLTSGTPAYYKVVVRLWLEGEDTGCKTETYVNLANSWKLDLQFDMVPSADTSTPAIMQMTTGAPATIVDDVPDAP